MCYFYFTALNAINDLAYMCYFYFTALNAINDLAYMCYFYFTALNAINDLAYMCYFYSTGERDYNIDMFDGRVERIYIDDHNVPCLK